jgi:hypothetical protein
MTKFHVKIHSSDKQYLCGEISRERNGWGLHYALVDSASRPNCWLSREKCEICFNHPRVQLEMLVRHL